MKRTNVYKVQYNEYLAQQKLETEKEDVLKESTEIVNVILADTQREALDKAEAQVLKYFQVFNVSLIETQVNVM